MNEEHPSRRSFLGRLMIGSALAWCGGIAAGMLAYLLPPGEVQSALGPRRVRAGREDEIGLGAGKLILVDDDPVWVVHVASGFVAFSARCTHKGCTITWEERRHLFTCPCHEGLFDARGNVAGGLPRRPLASFRVGAFDGMVYVSRTRQRV